MALLTPPPVLPSAMFLVARCLKSADGTMSWEQLVKQVDGVQESHENRRDTLKHVCSGGRHIKVFEYKSLGNDSSSISLASDVDLDLGTTYHGQLQEFRKCLLRKVMGAYQEDWESDAGAADFLRLLSWWLMQDLYAFKGTLENVDTEARTQANDDHVTVANVGSLPRWDRITPNATRWSNFVRWCTFLGFGRYLNLGERIFFVDPTVALRFVVDEMDPREWPIEDFLREIAGKLPCVDSGSVCEDVKRYMKPQSAVMKRMEDGRVSSALSHALLRLDDEGLLELINRSDAPSTRTLDGQEASENRVTDVTVLRGGDGSE